MSESLARGLCATLLGLALGCGRIESSRQTPEGPASRAGAAGHETATGGKTTSTPPASGGTSEPAGQGGRDSAGGETIGTGGEAIGAGGAAPEQPCAGIVARCVPGEPVCDPVRGKLTTCSECGEALPGGETECVRLLSSDKESNGFCVVRASNQLECWGGWGEARKSLLPSDVVALLLPDDYDAYRDNPPMPCLHQGTWAYSCLKGASQCTNVAVGDAGVCAICSQRLHCEGSVTTPAVAVPSPIDVTITDSSALVLGAIGLVTMDLPPRLPTFWKGAPAQLRVDHQFAGCIISDVGELACWMDLTEALRPSPWLGKYRKLVPATMPRVCVLDDARQLRCGDIFADTEPAPLGSNETSDFTASDSTVCALSVAGRVSCWDGAGAPLDLPDGW
jgi:hypothetical protein